MDYSIIDHYSLSNFFHISNPASLVVTWGFDKLKSIPLRALIESDDHGADILEATDEDGWGLLHLAAFKNDHVLAQAICASGSEKNYRMTNKTNDAGETAFGMALRLEHTKVAKIIARHRGFALTRQGLGEPGPFGAVLSIEEHPCGPLWHLAAAKSIGEARKQCAAVPLKGVRLEIDFGFQKINYLAVKAALEKMATEYNLGSGFYNLDVASGFNILQHAVHDGADDVARLILQHKPAIDLTYDQGNAGSAAVLYSAVEYGHVSLVRTLLEHLDDDSLLNLEDKRHGDTPRDRARKNNSSARVDTPAGFWDRKENNSAILKMIEDFDAAAVLAKSTNIAECRKVVDGLKDAQRCTVCVDRPKERALPCGHVFCEGKTHHSYIISFFVCMCCLQWRSCIVSLNFNPIDSQSASVDFRPRKSARTANADSRWRRWSSCSCSRCESRQGPQRCRIVMDSSWAFEMGCCRCRCSIGIRRVCCSKNTRSYWHWGVSSMRRVAFRRAWRKRVKADLLSWHERGVQAVAVVRL